MSPKAITYIGYLAIAVPLTIYVGRTLFRNGKVFLHDVFGGDDDLADAVNRLLVVGFYLLNLGYVALFLRTDSQVDDAERVLEVLSFRIGIVAIVLGVVHLANVWVFNAFRRRAALQRQWAPPVAPDEYTEVAGR